MELARADDLSGPVSTEETVYTSALADSLGDTLLQVNVSVSSQAPGQTTVHNATGKSPATRDDQDFHFPTPLVA